MWSSRSPAHCRRTCRWMCCSGHLHSLEFCQTWWAAVPVDSSWSLPRRKLTWLGHCHSCRDLGGLGPPSSPWAPSCQECRVCLGHHWPPWGLEGRPAQWPRLCPLVLASPGYLSDQVDLEDRAAGVMRNIRESGRSCESCFSSSKHESLDTRRNKKASRWHRNKCTSGWHNLLPFYSYLENGNDGQQTTLAPEKTPSKSLKRCHKPSIVPQIVYRLTFS